MIKKLKWDTDFFGFSIGKLIIKKKNEFNSHKIEKSFKLIYVFSNVKLDISDFLVDTKVILSKPITQNKKQDNCFEYNLKKHSYNELLKLTYLSGKHSRFKTDKMFSSSQFEKLYKTWINQSISKKNAFSTIIKYIDNKIVGFITLQEINKQTCTIGLIAVNELYQGKSIATDLIKHSENLAFNKGYSFIEVATQLNNVPAINLYKKNGFKVKKTTYIYHLWN